jgi:hypothetical protein
MLRIFRLLEEKNPKDVVEVIKIMRTKLISHQVLKMTVGLI